MKKEALNFIKSRRTETRETRLEPKYSGGIDPMYQEKTYTHYTVEYCDAEKAIDIATKGMYIIPTWIKIDNKHPLPKFEEVLAYNKEWNDGEFNPTGIRIGYLNDEGDFVSAVYDSDYEGYGCCREEGDDYSCEQLQQDGTTKTWYYRNGKVIEGYLPNMPTHYMLIPKCK